MLKNADFENVEKKMKKPVTFLPFWELMYKEKSTTKFLPQNSFLSGFATFE